MALERVCIPAIVPCFPVIRVIREIRGQTTFENGTEIEFARAATERGRDLERAVKNLREMR
jgi:hypothetical protein